MPPSRRKSNQEREELGFVLAHTTGHHAFVCSPLEHLQIIPFVTKFAVFETITAIAVGFPLAWIFGEGQQTAGTTSAHGKVMVAVSAQQRPVFPALVPKEEEVEHEKQVAEGGGRTNRHRVEEDVEQNNVYR